MDNKWEKREERADRDEAEGRFKEFDNIEDLIADLKEPGTMKLCNNPGCNTCLSDCQWRVTT